MSFKPISTYGFIGNQGSCALVNLDGSIDWCCLPRIDSPSIFAAILDPENGGYFQIVPSDPILDAWQEYVPDTNILITRFKTSMGTVEIMDWMHMGQFRHEEMEFHRLPAVYRMIKGLEGTVRMRAEFVPRLDYGRADTLLAPSDGSILASSAVDAVRLHATVAFDIQDHCAEAHFEVQKSQEYSMILTYGRTEWQDLTQPPDSLRQTEEYWRQWVENGRREREYALGEWAPSVTRSALTLKILAGGNGIAAAATTSLPEIMGKGDNWDYRFNWVRDTSFTLQALITLGHYTDAREFLDWLTELLHTGGRRPVDIQTLYPLHSTNLMPEEELPHLRGYMDSRPVRIGNLAAHQRQLDIYGEIMETVYRYEKFKPQMDEKIAHVLKDIVEYVTNVWKEPDHGIWELRVEPAHYVYSKVMCWVAIDRGIKLAEKHDWHVDIDCWKKEREMIHSEIMKRGYSEKRNSFVQAFHSEILDATTLLLPLLEFIPPDHPYALSTLDAVMTHLSVGPHVYRSEAHHSKEGAFGFCSFWLVDALVLAGRIDQARDHFLQLLGSANHLGLYAEEIDPKTGLFLGNFPQAFTHVGLINSAVYLAQAQGMKHPEAELIGEKNMPD